MNYFSQTGIALISALGLYACSDTANEFDASGAFEADEIIISAEVSGTLNQFTIEEGQVLEKGQTVGVIDSTQLYLKKVQLQAQIDAILSKKPNVNVQLASLDEQLKAAEKEQQRISNLVKSDAATPKQLDDINAQIEVIKRQIEAQKSTLNISSAGIGKESVPLTVQIEQLNDQLSKCVLKSPVSGTVLTSYAEQFELAAPGKPLYKIADLSTIYLKAYISGDQLPLVKLNQTVKVFTDNGTGGYNEHSGTITQISDKAEFTPKTIQTKDERANLVYAIKVKVVNDGSLKIGMYGEIKF